MRLKDKTAIFTVVTGPGEGMALRFAKRRATSRSSTGNPETTPAVVKRL